MGLFWVGLGLFRVTLHLSDAWPRIVGGVVLAGLIVVGATVSGLAALVCLLAGSAGLVVIEQQRAPAPA